MDKEERGAAVFGLFDGCVSIVGFVFALMLAHSSNHLIAIGALGGAISAMISMGLGQFETTAGRIHQRIGAALAMAGATLIGSLVPVWGFFLFPRPTALIVAGAGSLAIAGLIGWAKKKGTQGYLEAYATLLIAVGLTFLILSVLPSTG